MATKKVVVQGGGKNLFRIWEDSKGWFHASECDPGFLTDDFTSIGKAQTLAEAIVLIKAYTGKNVQSMSDW